MVRLDFEITASLLDEQNIQQNAGGEKKKNGDKGISYYLSYLLHGYEHVYLLFAHNCT